MTRVHWVVCLVGAGLAGCAVGPDYKPPAPPKGAAAPFISADRRTETSQEPQDAWWRLYHDATMNRVVEQALAANQDLAAAQANLRSAKAQLDLAAAGRYPATTLSAGGIYGRDAATDEILEIGGHRPFTTWIVNDILGFSYELDLFGRVRRSIEASRDAAQAAAAARDEIRATLAADTVRAYARICALGEELAVARHSVNIARRATKITVDRHAAGANSTFDVVRAEEVLAATQAELPPIEGQRRLALFELTALMGLTPAQAPEETLACAAPPLLRDRIPLGDPMSLLHRRPDISEAERRLAASTARIGVAVAELYPRISLSGLYGGIATSVPQLATNNGLTWGAGPSISWAFPIQAAPRARVQQANAEASAALAHFDAVILDALKQVEQALSAYGADLDHQAAVAVAREKAQEAYRLAHDALLAGSITTLDQLTSEQALITQDRALADADASIIQDQIAIFRALGVGGEM
jgi:NodT family efflux transporter outer membrane factor (OMF) lipoprotein